MIRPVLFLLLFSLALAGCEDKTDAGKALQRKEIRGAALAEVKAQDWPEIVEVAGTVKARTISLVSSRVMGTVTSVLVNDGDRVKKGQLLLTIDDSDMAQRALGAEAGLIEARKGLGAAKEHLELMEATYARYKNLHDAKAVSGQEFDTISRQRNTARLEAERMEGAVKRAGAAAREAAVMKGFTKIIAPADGVVSGKKIDAGSMASPGVPLLVIEDDSSYLIEADIDEGLSGKITEGSILKARIDSIERDLEAKITEVAPSMEPLTRTFRVKAAIKEDGLRTGQYARVFLPIGMRQAITAPREAVVSRGQLTGLYVVDEKGKAVYRLVRLGRPLEDGRVEIISGLSAGERIIASGAEQAFDGGIVKGVE